MPTQFRCGVPLCCSKGKHRKSGFYLPRSCTARKVSCTSISQWRVSVVGLLMHFGYYEQVSEYNLSHYRLVLSEVWHAASMVRFSWTDDQVDVIFLARPLFVHSTGVRCQDIDHHFDQHCTCGRSSSVQVGTLRLGWFSQRWSDNSVIVKPFCVSP